MISFGYNSICGLRVVKVLYIHWFILSVFSECAQNGVTHSDQESLIHSGTMKNISHVSVYVTTVNIMIQTF